MKFSRRFKVISIVVISIAVIAIFGAKILAGYAEKTISEKLAKANLELDSLQVSIFTRSISASNLRWTYTADSAVSVPHQIQLSHISIQGIGVLRYLLYHDLHISKIETERGDVMYNHLIKSNKQKTPAEGTGKLNAIEIDELVVGKTNVQITSDTTREYSALISFTLKGVKIENIGEEDLRYNINGVEALAEHIVLQGTKSLYNTNIGRTYINSRKGIVEIDSIHMNPLKGKYEFANSLGRQKTRVILHMPAVRMSGFDYDALRDSVLSVSTTEVRAAHLSVFRDKRLPFKNPLIPLPMKMLKDEIPFGLKLDTIRIINSTILHEEIAEGGSEIGKVNLTEVTATISNFNNRLYDDRPPFSVITASSKFMNTGLIEASFFLPVKAGVNYEAVGKISHLNLQEINTITEAVGFVRIESGFMNRLNFNFKYNEYKSSGSLDINYENLKIIGLSKTKKNDINKLKTFILNALVKKNKDKDTPKEQRTGAIDIDRDRHRFVVNLWVMSLFDGLKSAVLPNTQEEGTPKK